MKRLFGTVPERELVRLDGYGMLGTGNRKRGTDAARVLLLGHSCSRFPILGSRRRRRHPNRPVIYASVRESEGVVNSAWVGASSTSSPASMNAVRSDTRAACCILCVTMTTVMS